MPAIINAELNIDWTNFEAVCKLADKLGRGMVVVKYKERVNYNITHATRAIEKDITILYRTP